MSNITDIFEKIIVDGNEISLQSLTSVNGLLNVGSQKDIVVDFYLKNNTEIPDDIFNGLKQLNYVYLPKSIKIIGNRAFANSTLSYINSLMNVNVIGDNAFSYTNLTYVFGGTNPGTVSNSAWSYIDTLTDDFKNDLKNKYTYIDFGDGTAYIQPINDSNNSYTYTGNEPGDNPNTSYNGDDPGTGGEPNINVGQYDESTFNYVVGTKYRMPLIYTTRSGDLIIQNIGTIVFEIIFIDETVDHADPFKLKIKVDSIDITNPLMDRTIDYNTELVDRYFWIPDTCITANIDFFSSVPGFVLGVDGVDAFLAMNSEDETYHPELENSYGITDYAIRKQTNDMDQYLLATIQN